MKPLMRLGLAGALAVAVTSAFFGCAQPPTQSSDANVTPVPR